MNRIIINYLKQLAEERHVTGKVHSALAYKRAINVIEHYEKQINDVDEIKDINGIGSKIRKLIIEIIKSGTLRVIDEQHFVEKDKLEILKLFNSVWGAGPNVSRVWYNHGYRSIEELKKNPDLNQKQKIGIKYYDDLKQKIPRREIELIKDKISIFLKSIDIHYIIKICGSFRRKCEFSGDIDCLISKNATDSKIDLNWLIQILKKNNIILNETFTNGKNTYMGLIRLNDKTPVRHIDIKVVEKEYLSSTMLYFTGPQLLNIEMRTRAKKQGWKLTKKGLFKYPDENYTNEKKIFTVLGLPYLKPEKRDTWMQRFQKQATLIRTPINKNNSRKIIPISFVVQKSFNELLQSIDEEITSNKNH